MKKYVLVGAGQRCFGMYAKPLVAQYWDVARIVGIFDPNRIRSEYIISHTDPSIPAYTDFDRMMAETKPDLVIVTTVDCFHHEYIIRALDYGCDVISEKPLTIDEVKCKAILDAEKKAGKKVIVTFNYRFPPYITRIKEMLKDGIVGKILSIDFEYLLDTLHGADYYRRWHRRKENSGGLLVHKSTHHFDFINWWIGEEPEEVYANGSRRFYGPTRDNKGERCSTCRFADVCEFAVRYREDPFMRDFYFEAEKEDGYFRDRCVFSDEIDIEDTMSVVVKYSKGALLTYSLITYSPYEGWKVSITGTGGRLEASETFSGQMAGESTNHVHVFNRKGEQVVYPVEKAEGDHAGGDKKLLDMLFRENTPDPLGHMAGSYDGVMAAMIGICANKSMKEKKMFRIGDFI